jgi:hypothetical protein
MVADEKRDDILAFNADDVKTWVKEFTVLMMERKRNHLGLRPHGLVAPAGNNRLDYEKKVETWKERNDTCVAAIYYSTKGNSDAYTIVDQYIERKEALPDNDPNKEKLASDLIQLLVERFEGEEEDEIGGLTSEFTNFAFEPLTPVMSGIDKMNTICQKLNQHGRPVLMEAKLSKVVEALEKRPELERELVVAHLNVT